MNNKKSPPNWDHTIKKRRQKRRSRIETCFKAVGIETRSGTSVITDMVNAYEADPDRFIEAFTIFKSELEKILETR